MAPAASAATRRELIARGIAFGRHGGDVGALSALARAEQVLVGTYEQLLGSAVLSPAHGVLASRLLGHERAHLSALTAQLERLGGTVPHAPAALGHTAAAGMAFGDERAALGMLVSLERAALAVYYAELGKLRDSRAAQVAAQIMACEAQHATTLRDVLEPGRPGRAVPTPFVFGQL
ncbi:MAG TPA: ferritin-like domain-containing protein [Solirubrobacteraceae bacterium]|nr:ferritin-like domain-containing protein [Solirubrobacteraceae bacterium]